MESINIVGLCNHRIHRLDCSFRHFELNWIRIFQSVFCGKSLLLFCGMMLQLFGMFATTAGKRVSGARRRVERERTSSKVNSVLPGRTNPRRRHYRDGKKLVCGGPRLLFVTQVDSLEKCGDCRELSIRSVESAEPTTSKREEWDASPVLVRWAKTTGWWTKISRRSAPKDGSRLGKASPMLRPWCSCCSVRLYLRLCSRQRYVPGSEGLLTLEGCQSARASRLGRGRPFPKTLREFAIAGFGQTGLRSRDAIEGSSEGPYEDRTLQPFLRPCDLG